MSSVKKITITFLIFVMFAGIFFFMKQAPSFFNRKPQVFQKIHSVLTFLPCRIWRHMLEKDTRASRYLFCQEREDCLWYPTCEFGFEKSFNQQYIEELKKKMFHWGEFCWQHNPCACKSMPFPKERKAICKNNLCQVAKEP